MRRSLLLFVCVSGCMGAVSGDQADAGAAVDSGPADAGAIVDAGTPPDAGDFDAGSTELDASVPDAGLTIDAGSDAGSSDAGLPMDAGSDAGTVPDAGDPCGGARLCEPWDAYGTPTLSNNTNLGPWRVSVPGPGSTATLDAARSRSGRALKIHMDQGSASGAQLRVNATSAPALFSTPRAQLYGRMWIYMGADGSSTHWTIFGASGTVPPGTPAAGQRATYLFSAFRNGPGMRNVFGDVYYNDQTRQDCWNSSSQLIPTNRWACISFFIDGQAMRYRFWLDGAPVPSMSVDTTGQGCVAHPANSPWYGPLFSEFYVGARSFHPMSAPMDFWIDDLAVDSAPLACP